MLLLEAGGEDKNRWIHIPLGFGKTFADPSVNWCYETEPDPGAADRRVFWPRGKVLGGSSSINGMVYIRGQAEDFDHWRQLGNTGWSFEDVLPYFKRAEHQTRGADAFHGTGGPLCVSDVPRSAPDLRSLHRGCDRARLSAQRRFQRRQPGRRRLPPDDDAQRPALLDRGRLSAPGDAAAQSAGRHRGADREDSVRRPPRHRRRASASDGRLYTARAAREVILCGGAVNSPQLLMLSGIGPQEHLAEFGVPVVHHLPGVGQSLQDHYSAPIKLRCRLPITVNDVMLSNTQEAEGRAANTSMFQRGPLAMMQLAGGAVRAHPPRTGLARHQDSRSRRSAPTARRTGCIRWSGFYDRSPISSARKAAARSN